MEIIEHLFFIGIIYIIFNIIWGILVGLPKLLIVGLNSNSNLDYSIKAIRYLLISTLTYLAGKDFIFHNNIENNKSPWIFILGGVVLALYLAGKLNKKQSMLKMTTMAMGNFNKKPIANQKLTYEPHIIGVSIVIYAACIAVPQIGLLLGENVLNKWFLTKIKDIYDTPFIGLIFSISGVFFLLSMFQKGIQTIQQFINTLLGKKPADNNTKSNPFNDIMGQFENLKKEENPFTKNQDKVDIEDDIYVDFEEVDNDDETKKT